MMQEQHDKQIAAIMAANKSSMDAMMERMNAMVAGKGADKENIKPKDDNKDKKPMRDKHTCPHCKLSVLHKPANCPELEENAHKRWTGWKSVNDTA
jgi:16S rRNA U516 pseudouridylate synthase RsuA-like enzyme